MILEQTINAINFMLLQSKIVEKAFGLCELLTDGDGNQYPAHYKGVGEYEQVFNPDKFIGLSYIRRNGTVAFANASEDSQYVDCEKISIQTIPLKIVCIVPKSSLPCDDAFADDFVADSIIAKLNNLTGFITGADDARVTITNYETDNQIILADEFSGIKITDIHYKYSYLVINLEAIITVDTSCFDPCGVPAEKFQPPAPQTLCEAIEDCEVITDLQSQIDACCQSSSLTNTYILVGNVANIATAVPLTLSGAGGAFALANTGVLTMPDADAATRGLLLAADWTAFSAKQTNYTILDTLGALADAVGWLYNDGAGNFVYSTPAGVTTFLALTDTPATYVGASLQSIRVNVGETALEFYVPSADFITSVSDTATIDLDVTAGVLTANFINFAGYIDGSQVTANETDPVFAAWLAVPPNISIFNNDSGYITSNLVTSVNLLTGAVALTGTANRITVSAANVFDIAAAYDLLWQPIDADLTAIAALGFVSTSFLIKTAANTWALDTNTYLTSVTAHDVLSATHGDTLAAAVARGSLIVGNSTPKWSALALGTAGKILRSDGTDLLYTTSTFADTYAVSTLLFASASNVVTGLATANGGILNTSATGVPSITATPLLGVAGATAGTLRLSGVTSGVVTIDTAAAAGTWSLTLPTTGGTANFFLQTDGSGVTTWAAAASGITIGTTAITNGTTTNILYNNAGIVGEYTLTGTGTVVAMQTAPTFVTSIISPLVIGGTGTTQTLIYKTTSGVGATGARHIFQVGNNGATEAMTILNNGNVGIGIVSTGELLHIRKDQASATKMVIQNVTSGGQEVMVFAGSTQQWNFGQVNNDAKFKISYDPNGSLDSSTVLTFVNNGRAGIGVTSPASVLHLKAATATFTDVAIEGAAAGDVNWILMSGYPNAGDFTIRQSDVLNAVTIKKTTGNVGIGTTSPTAVLHLKAGVNTASGAPLKFTSGTNLSTPENGCLEYNGTNFFATRAAAARENIVCASAVNAVAPTSPDRTITVNIDGTLYYIAAKTTND